MRIVIFVESWDGEICVVVIFEIVKKLVVVWYEVMVEFGVGVKFSIFDEVYVVVGVSIGSVEVVYIVEILFKVCVFNEVECVCFKLGMVVIGMLNFFDVDNIVVMVVVGFIVFGLEVVFCIICV